MGTFVRQDGTNYSGSIVGVDGAAVGVRDWSEREGGARRPFDQTCRGRSANSCGRMRVGRSSGAGSGTAGTTKERRS